MDIVNFNIYEVIGAVEGAWFLGWIIGFLLWLIRYIVIELPNTGSIFTKGGDI